MTGSAEVQLTRLPTNRELSVTTDSNYRLRPFLRLALSTNRNGTQHPQTHPVALLKIDSTAEFDLEVHSNGEVWICSLYIPDHCADDSSGSEPTERGKKQSSHSEIPGSCRLGDLRRNHFYFDR